MSNQPALVADLIPFFRHRRYEPGDRVPSERELAERFGVSRNQIREALTYLEALKIVERRSKSGIFLSNSELSLDAMLLYAELGVPVAEQAVHQAVEMRRIHEMAAVRLACERRTDADLAHLRGLLDAELKQIKQGGNMAVNDRDFHLAIIAATHNSVFLTLTKVFYAMTESLRHSYFQDSERQLTSHQQHEAIFSAIEQQDVAAAEVAMRAHLVGAEETWSRLFNANEQIQREQHG